MENAYNSTSEPLDFKLFRGGGGYAPQTPLKAHAFGARNLPRLVLKSRYGPVQVWQLNNYVVIALLKELLLLILPYPLLNLIS